MSYSGNQLTRQGEGRLSRFWKVCSYLSDVGMECVVRVSSRWWPRSEFGTDPNNGCEGD